MVSQYHMQLFLLLFLKPVLYSLACLACYHRGCLTCESSVVIVDGFLLASCPLGKLSWSDMVCLLTLSRASSWSRGAVNCPVSPSQCQTNSPPTESPVTVSQCCCAFSILIFFFRQNCRQIKTWWSTLGGKQTECETVICKGEWCAVRAGFTAGAWIHVCVHRHTPFFIQAWHSPQSSFFRGMSGIN